MTKETIHDFRNTAGALKSDLQNAADKAETTLRDTAYNAGRKAKEIWGTASDEISQATDTVTTQIRKKPVQSSLIALGAGVILGLLLRR